MVLNPDVQRKAHEELDTAVGRDRLPNFLDRANLPYVMALVLEAMRWRPVEPLGTVSSGRSNPISLQVLQLLLTQMLTPTSTKGI